MRISKMLEDCPPEDARACLYFTGRYIKQAKHFEHYEKDVFEEDEINSPSDQVRKLTLHLIGAIERREGRPATQFDDDTIIRLLDEITSMEAGLAPEFSAEEIAQGYRLAAQMLPPITPIEDTHRSASGHIENPLRQPSGKSQIKGQKVSDRVASEGLVGIAVMNGRGVAIEINSETDNVARSKYFQSAVRRVADLALTVSTSIEAIKSAHLGGKTVESLLQDISAHTGENISLRRLALIEGETVASYVHRATNEGVGKIGVLVALKGNATQAAAIGKQFAMHIAATAPLALKEEMLDPISLMNEFVRNEIAFQTEIERSRHASTENLAPDADNSTNITSSRLKQFAAENTLLNQRFVMNPDLTVETAAKEAGVEITDFVRFSVGEGIKIPQEDVLAEDLESTLIERSFLN